MALRKDSSIPNGLVKIRVTVVKRVKNPTVPKYQWSSVFWSKRLKFPFRQTMETLHELEEIYVFDSFIRVDSSVEWAQDNSAPVVEYKKSSRSAKEYTALAEEVMRRVSR